MNKLVRSFSLGPEKISSFLSFFSFCSYRLSINTFSSSIFHLSNRRKKKKNDHFNAQSRYSTTDVIVPCLVKTFDTLAKLFIKRQGFSPTVETKRNGKKHFLRSFDKMFCLAVKSIVFLFVVAFGQDVSISEPKLISIDSVNSTALTVTWTFLNSTFDQSDRVQISINFIEFFYNYNVTYPSINFTFASTNKTTTSLTKNFPLVNAFYFVCFSSNSSRMNSSRIVLFHRCDFKRTCLRSNASVCPSASFVIVSSSSITSNSFLITIHWLKNLPYLRQTTNVQFVNSKIIATSLNSIDNDTYTSFPYRFDNLQSNSNYTVNLTIGYLLFDRLFSETQFLSVTTSRSTNLFNAGERTVLFIGFFLYLTMKFE